MKLKRFLALVLSACMLLSLVPAGAANAQETEELVIEQLNESDVNVNLHQNAAPGLELEQNEMDPNASVKVIIVMEGDSIIQEDSNASLTPEVQTKIKKLEDKQENVVNKIENTVLNGADLDVSYSYTWLINGVAATVPYGTIEQIEAIEGVVNVFIQPVYSVCETADAVATPNTITDGVMIGRESAWANGYTGEGMKIAIIDTGLDTDHQNFAALGEDKLTDTSATPDTVGAVLANLHASERYAGLTVGDVYYSTKVVYGFNYCDDDLDITHADGAGDHGTHVAGIAAANKVESSEVVGVAPDAQLYVLKVFGKNGGAYAQDILAALEDALMLGADVINMSLGSPAGFTSGDTTELGTLLDPVYASVAETGTVLSVSGGNNYDSGYYNNWGTDANLTQYPDNGVLGSPGTYANTLTVASVENLAIQRVYIDADGYIMPYVDSDTYNLPAMTTLTGEYQIVVIPGNGEPSDYEGLDVTGKIALVQRGVTSFVEKHLAAEAAGAIACLIYNNTTGEFGMDMTGTTATTPAAAITMADGAYLVAAVAENPEFTISFPTTLAGIPSETAYEMSVFSSKGPAPDLTMAPDITAPGGNIYSTVDNGQYGLMSGTSMAAPNIAGMTALVMQYVREKFPEAEDQRALTQDLLMSTSMPLAYDEESGLAYSPRSQGSGLANVYNAVTTQVYLTVDGEETVKVNLGEDSARSGAYSYSFNVHNFGETDAYFRLDTSVQTEGYTDIQGYYFMSGTPYALSGEAEETADGMILTYDVDNDGDTDSHDAYHVYRASIGQPETEGWESESFRYDLDANDAVAAADVQAYLDELVGKEADVDLDDTVLQVAAGETTVVSVDVTLSDADKAYLDTYYVNGGYVEGFTTLTALHTEGVDLSLPYLGFYGDWSEAPVLDDGDYWDMLSEDYDPETSVVGNQYVNILFTEFDGEEAGAYPGLNVYVDEPFELSNAALSPNDDGFMDNITDIYLSLLRNASSLTLRYSNTETGEVYYENAITNAPKSVFYSAYGQIIPYIYTWYNSEPLFDWAGLENNTTVLFEAEVVGVDEGDEPEIWSLPITVDLEAPQLISAERIVDEANGTVTLELTYQENHAVAAAGLLTSDGSGLVALEGVDNVEPNAEGYQVHTTTFDITGQTGKVMVVLADYALNESYYGINLGGEGTPYGDLVAFQYNYGTGVNGWVSFDADVAQNETQIFMSGVNFVAAEYVNGFVFAQTESGALYGFAYEDMLNDTMDLESTYIAQLDYVYQDLAYSYAEGKLYGLLVYEDDGYPTTEINSINLNGEYYDPNLWMTVAPYQEDWILNRGGVYGLTLACDDAGSLYVLGLNYDRDTESLGETAHLWTVGLEYDSWSDSYMMGWSLSQVGDTGLTMDYLQSMAWDHNAEKLYWARFDGNTLYTESELIEIDPATAACTKVGTLSGETCALFAPLIEENMAKEEHANVPDMDNTVVGTPILRDATVTMNVGGTKTLSYDIDPWYTSVKEVVWSSDNESVVTVDQNGTITAVGTGSATVTVAAAADAAKFDTCTVEVTALDLKLEGIISAQTSGVGAVTGVSTYAFEMVDGAATYGTIHPITAPADLNYGLSLATSEMGRGSIWACEYGNTGMIYEIDPDTGAVVDALQPIDGDMMFGLAYSETLDSFTGIMNFYLYVDQPLNHWAEEQIMNSYDDEEHAFMWRRINMLEYLLEANGGFVTGETGQGASSEIVFTGITLLEGGESQYMYTDYMGGYGPEITYTPTQTLVVMDNVGRLWYIDEVTGMTAEATSWGTTNYVSADGMSTITDEFHGVEAVEIVDEAGNTSYSVFVIRKLEETPLTTMFREGSLPRMTYHFSDIEFAGYTAEGAPMYAISLYDYWNNGTTNELYLYVPGVGTGEFEWDENWNRVEITTPDRLYALGNTGEHNIIATIHKAEVTGGVDAETAEAAAAPLAVGVYNYQDR